MNVTDNMLDQLDAMKSANEALALRDEAAGQQTDEYFNHRLRYEQLVDDSYHAFRADGDRDALDRLVRDHRDALDFELAEHYDATQPKPWTLAELREPVENDLAETERAQPPHHHHM